MSLCTNLEDLVDAGHSITPALLPLLANTHLRRVTINIMHLYAPPRRIVSTHLVFAFLTHIDRVDSFVLRILEVLASMWHSDREDAARKLVAEMTTRISDLRFVVAVVHHDFPDIWEARMNRGVDF
ncbi:hypothetical protein K438DRAFT_1955178 [Mycena galopus ATCC 62051]|nr:hypothetical protein K438DRAFT_1955178 [Mycena galopus ATCC 62051]